MRTRRDLRQLVEERLAAQRLTETQIADCFRSVIDDAGPLDLGELLAEHLALAIDPYPRKPGVELEQVLQKNGIDVKVGRASPFAVLSELKSKS